MTSRLKPTKGVLVGMKAWVLFLSQTTQSTVWIYDEVVGNPAPRSCYVTTLLGSNLT